MDGAVWGDTLAPVNLIIHLLSGVVLLGAVTHHLVMLLKGRGFKNPRVLQRYAFWVCTSYLVTFFWGLVIYPAFAYHVRYLYADEHTPWATAIFEIKEHILAVGLGILPLYYLGAQSASELNGRQRGIHALSLCTLAAIVWYSFIAGAILVNSKGL